MCSGTFVKAISAHSAVDLLGDDGGAITNVARELITYFGEMVNHLIANVMKAGGDDETLDQRQIGK